MSFVAEADSGHALVMDGSVEIGGRNLGAAPHGTPVDGSGRLLQY